MKAEFNINHKFSELGVTAVEYVMILTLLFGGFAAVGQLFEQAGPNRGRAATETSDATASGYIDTGIVCSVSGGLGVTSVDECY